MSLKTYHHGSDKTRVDKSKASGNNISSGKSPSQLGMKRGMAVNGCTVVPWPW